MSLNDVTTKVMTRHDFCHQLLQGTSDGMPNFTYVGQPFHIADPNFNNNNTILLLLLLLLLLIII